MLKEIEDSWKHLYKKGNYKKPHSKEPNRTSRKETLKTQWMDVN